MAWLFGAGSSVAAGVPTAYDLTWDFKRRIYCADQLHPLHIFNNLTDPAIREQIQTYFDSQGTCPPRDSNQEYSYYFERLYPQKMDRSAYIESQVSGLQLTFGHHVAGALMKNGFCNLIFTTNFDRAFEETAHANFSSVSGWHTANLENGESGVRAFHQGKRPLIVKLHGDYGSNHLKNTATELQQQDKNLRGILSRTILTGGLCVMGYSGRDESVMDVIRESITEPNSYPGGLYWFNRSGSTPMAEVVSLIDQAKSAGKTAEIVEIDTFDSAFGDLIKGFDLIPQADLDRLYQRRQRMVNQPLPAGGKRYPLIRLNALPIAEFPATARLYKCAAGNTKEIQQIILASNSNILAIRKLAGVVGFGPDQEFDRLFSQNAESQKEIFQISEKELLYDDSGMKGLVTSGLLMALANLGPFRKTKRRSHSFLFPDPKRIAEPYFDPLKAVLNPMTGTLPNTGLIWVAAAGIKIEYVASKAFLLISPTILASKASSKAEASAGAPFIKEMMARWYNNKYNEILSAWIELFFGAKNDLKVSAFPNLSSGFDAAFKISRTSAYSLIN